MIPPQGTDISGELVLGTGFCTLFLSQHFHQVVLKEVINNIYTVKEGKNQLIRENRDFEVFQQVKIRAKTDSKIPTSTVLKI